MSTTTDKATWYLYKKYVKVRPTVSNAEFAEQRKAFITSVLKRKKEDILRRFEEDGFFAAARTFLVTALRDLDAVFITLEEVREGCVEFVFDLKSEKPENGRFDNILKECAVHVLLESESDIMAAELRITLSESTPPTNHLSNLTNTAPVKPEKEKAVGDSEEDVPRSRVEEVPSDNEDGEGEDDDDDEEEPSDDEESLPPSKSFNENLKLFSQFRDLDKKGKKSKDKAVSVARVGHGGERELPDANNMREKFQSLEISDETTSKYSESKELRELCASLHETKEDMKVHLQEIKEYLKEIKEGVNEKIVKEDKHIVFGPKESKELQDLRATLHGTQEYITGRLQEVKDELHVIKEGINEKIVTAIQTVSTTEDWFPVTWMYHDTQSSNQIFRSGFLLPKQANDGYYDFALATPVAPPVVFFCGTLISSDKITWILPMTSQYPRWKKGPRDRFVLNTFFLREYHMVYIGCNVPPKSQNTVQVHYLFFKSASAEFLSQIPPYDPGILRRDPARDLFCQRTYTLGETTPRNVWINLCVADTISLSSQDLHFFKDIKH